MLNFGCEMPPKPPNTVPQKCCFYHQDTEKCPLGMSWITPDQDGKTTLELLELSDPDVQNKFNQFNLGGSKLINFQNYKEAESELLERNFPAIDQNKQDRPIFLPETYLNKLARAVDVEGYACRMTTLDDEWRAFLGINKGTEDLQNIQGDQTEKQISDALKKCYTSKTNTDPEVLVLQGV